MTEPTELLPCPFCGGAPTTIERPDNIDGTQFFYAIACYCGRHSACAHKMAVRKTPEIAKADAIAAWNTRTQQPTQAQAGAVPLTPEQIKALTQARSTAMQMAAEGRIPECGDFAAIAQNLDWLCDSFGIKGGQHAE